MKSLEIAGDEEGANAKREQMHPYIETNCPDYEDFKDAVYTALEKGGTATPFAEYPQSSFLPTPKNWRRKLRKRAKTEIVAIWRMTHMAWSACSIRSACSSSAWSVFTSNVGQDELFLRSALLFLLSRPHT